MVGRDRDALVRQLRARWRPNAVRAIVDDVTDEAVAAIPLLEGRSAGDGPATAYVCRNGTCKMPVTEPGDLEEQLALA